MTTRFSGLETQVFSKAVRSASQKIQDQSEKNDHDLGFDNDTFSQEVHSWSSYKHDEIVWNGRFTNILEELQDGRIKIDLNRISDYEFAN